MAIRIPADSPHLLPLSIVLPSSCIPLTAKMDFKLGNLTSRGFLMKAVELVRWWGGGSRWPGWSSCWSSAWAAPGTWWSGVPGQRRLPGLARAQDPGVPQLCRLNLLPREGGKRPHFRTYGQVSQFFVNKPLLCSSPGYFFICLILMLGLVLGDSSKYGVRPLSSLTTDVPV